jgi:hypothetical protein
MPNRQGSTTTRALMMTEQQLVALRMEYARSLRQRNELEKYIKNLEARIESTSKLVARLSSEPSVVRPPVRRRARGQTTKGSSTDHPPQMKSDSWTEAVYRVVTAADRLMTMDELRNELARTRAVGKAWISGVQRLKDTGHIVSYKKRIGTPAARQRFLEDVVAGRAGDLEPGPPRSRWGLAIYAVLQRRNRDLTAHEIRLELQESSEFADKLKRSPYRIYQVLRALVAAGRVEKRRTFYRLSRKDM